MANFQSETDKNYILEQLCREIRLDGRKYFQHRQITVFFGQQPGNVQVYLGNTHILAKTCSDIVEPKKEAPTEGFLKFKIDISAMSEEQDQNAQTTKNYSNQISKLLERIIKDTKAIDTESLCLISGKSVWSINVDTTLVNNDGNLIDAIYLANIISLLHYRKPQVKIESQDKITVYDVSQKQAQPLSIHHIPLTFTYCIFKDAQYILVDPLLAEEQIMDGRITIAMNIYQDICSIHKPGGAPIDPSHLAALIEATSKKVSQMTNFVRSVLKNCQSNTILNLKQKWKKMVYDFSNGNTNQEQKQQNYQQNINFQYKENQQNDNNQEYQNEQQDEAQIQSEYVNVNEDVDLDELKNELENRQ